MCHTGLSLAFTVPGQYSSPFTPQLQPHSIHGRLLEIVMQAHTWFLQFFNGHKCMTKQATVWYLKETHLPLQSRQYLLSLEPMMILNSHTHTEHDHYHLSTFSTGIHSFLHIHPWKPVVLTSYITSNILWEETALAAHTHILLLTNLWKPCFWSFVTNHQTIQSLNFSAGSFVCALCIAPINHTRTTLFVLVSSYLQVYLQMLGHWFLTSVLS